MTVLVYQPQVEEFSGNALAGRAAVSVKNPSAGNVPVFGAIWFEAVILSPIETSSPVPQAASTSRSGPSAAGLRSGKARVMVSAGSSSSPSV